MKAWVLSLVFFLAACNTDTAEEQHIRGAQDYELFCQSCHDQDQGIGPRLTPEVLSTRTTAAHLYSYNREKMPYNAGRLLTDEQYWDITAYLLYRSNLASHEGPLHQNNADYLLEP